jgi:hypothetical protein
MHPELDTRTHTNYHALQPWHGVFVTVRSAATAPSIAHCVRIKQLRSRSGCDTRTQMLWSTHRCVLALCGMGWGERHAHAANRGNNHIKKEIQNTPVCTSNTGTKGSRSPTRSMGCVSPRRILAPMRLFNSHSLLLRCPPSCPHPFNDRTSTSSESILEHIRISRHMILNSIHLHDLTSLFLAAPFATGPRLPDPVAILACTLRSGLHPPLERVVILLR